MITATVEKEPVQRACVVHDRPTIKIPILIAFKIGWKVGKIFVHNAENRALKNK